MSGRLAGRTAVVVGGGQTEGETVGNGRAVALAFAREGAHVLVADRDPAGAEATADLIRAEGHRADAQVVDITSEDQIKTLADTVRRSLGRLDVLHNNVGVVAGGGTEQIDEARWRLAFDVNLHGMWLTLKHLLPIMREQGSGAVINISSLASFGAGAATIGYSTSKAAVNAMSRSLALEYAPHGVRINVIAPGMIDTPMGVDTVARATGRPRDQVAAERAALIPMGRQGSAWDIANAAVFLASDEAAYITGAVLPVDGGSTLTIATPTHR
ncbi:NAD(P)-dependent dehydrogenase (short-subunit alcohol dehydrogenase family) [Catenuloplanes nepalensis]|uniref:NAD(P)-dependent dehydrogenase (Short-subunit alcohol dehydrogenase family) n=1 Tax=Catenuloplanes nepalensis TaxID=587533 RepID=A0ABT9MNI3_9ACTN|nr:SDR family NAD(P)-dependent oxidoreductase [Catenuloplanes nepalensis]MDP9792986.1 NAD(P)-dependent dehydrogenase (short-subunit alcohol dehydrogenase family) [Catenuloplanes nepalensis]